MYRRQIWVSVLVAVGFVCCFPPAAAYALASAPRTACPTYHTQYDALVNGAANSVITARHRGNFTGELPENSLGAFIRSFDECQPHVETDVRTTRDGRLVLFHDVNIGKMLEPAYDPDSDRGPNARINDLTFEELRRKKLLTIDRRATEYEVPTVAELLTTMVNRNAGSLVSLEVKEPRAIIPTAQTVANLAKQYATSNLEKRVIIKFSMENFPTPQHWRDALKRAGVTQTIMADPVMRPASAAQIDAQPRLPDVPGIRATTNSERAIAAWSRATSAVAPVVSVLLKDNSEFLRTVDRRDPVFGSYAVPENLSPDNARDGSMARMYAIAKYLGKKTEIFLPIPDYVMWRSGPVAGYTVQNYFGDKQPIDVRRAYFNNNSSCCYALEDRRTPTPYASERADMRPNLGWLLALEVTLITADDSDSIEMYAKTQGRLNLKARPRPHQAPAKMESALSYTVAQTSPTTTSYVKLKGWNGGSSGAWQGQVCLWSANSEGWAWVVKCGMSMTAGYTDTLEISVVNGSRMRIRDTRNWECLRWIPGETEVVDWSRDCSGREAEWTRTRDNRYLTGEGRALGFQWQDRYFWGVPFSYAVPTYDTSAWTRWTFR